MMRVTVPIAIAVLLLAGGWTLQTKLAADRAGTWSEVKRDDLVIGVEVTGTLAAVESDQLGPPPIPDVWDFKISMMRPEGTVVKQGQPVLAFDTSQLERNLEELRAESEAARKEIERKEAGTTLQIEAEDLKYAESEGRLRKSALKLEAPENLLGRHETRTAKLDHDLARNETVHVKRRIEALQTAAHEEIGLLRNRLARAERKVRDLESQIAQMNVRAPREGTVIYLTNWRGEKKKVGDSAWKGEKILEIPEMTKMMGRGEVDEADAGKVRLGQQVTLRLDAHPDDELTGKLQTLSRTVQRQSPRNPIKVLRVEIELDRTDTAKMRPGMRFRGTVVLDRVRKAVVIPASAVFVGADGPYVRRRSAFAIEDVKVKFGRRNEKMIEVVDGLEVGDRVLVASDEEPETK